ncbi:EamA family transporter RarD [Echinimonas agarilytica]|uniref:EamA family transporter RarD n=1 Tax=Echinimonas agarilytica TaxID=1215918 RepID=A0AA42B631_9GAMM|nr:EamA family transporter RarD [Echinimonas agarilytica]MCM2678265.1 EamA family transporter RarD [Echinimonas agarilytica]
MQNTAKHGAIFAILAYSMWGIAPLYFKLLSQIPALEMIGHRVLWSFFLLVLIISLRVGWQPVKDILKTPKKLAWLCVSSLLIAINWLVFIWAINADHMLDASLGYYINPIVNVGLGMFFLGERLARLQWLAIGLASCGVLVQLITFGSIPWIALILAVSFGLYGLIRKQVVIDGVSGLWIETLLLAPFALAYLCFIAPHNIPMSQYDGVTQILLVAAGIVTTLPLLCFIAAAKRLPLSVLGFFQYIGPSLMFLLATLVYDEPLTQDKIITFGFIWLALIVFSWHGWRTHRRTEQASAIRSNA